MSQNAFSAGVEPGGLYSRNDIELLICYMLLSVEEPIEREAVLEIVAGNGMANFFESGAAIDELLRLGNLTESGTGGLSLSEKGRAATATLYDRLPYTLRERSVKAAVQLLSRRRNERENDVRIIDTADDCTVICSINDADRPLMEVSLRVADTMQGQLIRDRFLDDPTLLYRSLIAVLTGDAALQPDGRQIVIRLP